MSKHSSVFTFQHLLMLAILVTGGLAAETIAPDGEATWLWASAVGAGLVGIGLARLSIPDSLSHLVAIGTGIAGAVALAAMRLAEQSTAETYWGRMVTVTAEIRDWYVGSIPGNDTETLLITILLQMVVWLTSYLAAWSLVRQNWLTVALGLPGILVLGSVRLGSNQPAYLLEVFVVLSIMLLARSTYVNRAGGQKRESGGTQRRFGWYSVITGAIVGVLVTGVGAATPEGFSENTLQPVVEVASESYLSAQQNAGDWLADQLDIAQSGSNNAEGFPRYTAFDDAFSVGGELNLSDQPEVLVRTDGQAPYLAAQSYDLYNGRGWESTVEETFDADGPDGVRYSPELTFKSEQEVPYSASVENNRSSVNMEVSPLTPSGKNVFTSGMYLTADEQTSVRMSWVQMDGNKLPLREMDLSTIPPDLTGMVSLLLRVGELAVEGDGGLQYPSDRDDRQKLEDMRSQLSDRFIDVSWTVANDGRVSELVVTGQLPVYDDNVSVRRVANNSSTDPYVVTSLITDATKSDLQAAPTEYPDWVRDRYLSLPDTVTDRTIQLSNNLAAGLGNPYDQAKAVEDFLRTQIEYDLDVGLPPMDADIVDYVIFESQRGYCEYYASAMTVMMRALGVPAKTVVGYYPADYDQEEGGYLYRQENAHAWTEVYFAGYGWIPFEPTAARPASSLDGNQGSAELLPTPTPTPEPELVESTPLVASPVPTVDVPESPAIVPEEPPASAERDWTPVILAASIAVVLIGAFGYWMKSLRVPTLESGSIYGSMLRWGRAGGVGSDPSSTPREYARHFGRKYPDLANDAADIVDVYEQQRYGGAVAGPSSLRRAANALRRLRKGIMRTMFRVSR